MSIDVAAGEEEGGSSAEFDHEAYAPILRPGGEGPPMEAAQIRLSEIFLSLQGESNLAGWPTVFVRLVGCPLRCGYCDSSFAFSGGRWTELPELLEEIARYSVRHVTVTGGEPLAQAGVVPLLRALCDRGYVVSLETSGALDVRAVDPRVIKILDVKTPGSGEVERNLWSNLDHLLPRDQVKFVLTDRADYDWAKGILDRFALPSRVEILFSPCSGRIEEASLAEWILQDRLPVRFQLQLHKVLWGDVRGR